MKKILIVDDQCGIRILLSEVLGQEGYEVFDAGNGQDTMRLIEKEIPDLVLLDVKIPVMSGVEILKWIKENYPSISVMMMTAYAELNLIQEALDLGAITCFSKPFDINEIIIKIEKMFNDQSCQ